MRQCYHVPTRCLSFPVCSLDTNLISCRIHAVSAPLCMDGKATFGVSQGGRHFVGTICLSRSTELVLSYFAPVFLTALGDAGISLCPPEPAISPEPLLTALALTLKGMQSLGRRASIASSWKIEFIRESEKS